MKLSVFFFFILLLFTYSIHSQERSAGTIEVIPTLGYSGSMVFGESNELKEPVFGIQYGILGDIYLNDRWSVHTGISYARMGGSDPYAELHLDYINIPVNANYHFGSNRQWNINFGLTPGFLNKGTFDGAVVQFLYESFQLAFSSGIGRKIVVSDTFAILIDLQSLIGITNILTEEVELKQTNIGGSLNVGGVFAF